MKKDAFDPAVLKEEWNRICDEKAENRWEEIAARAEQEENRREEIAARAETGAKRPARTPAGSKRRRGLIVSVSALCAAAAVAAVAVGLPLLMQSKSELSNGIVPTEDGHKGSVAEKPMDIGDPADDNHFSFEVDPDPAVPDAEIREELGGDLPGADGTHGGGQVTAGTLTAGQWNDNDHWDFWLSLQNGQKGYETYLRDWGLTLTRRMTVTTAPQAAVQLKDADGAVLWTAVADNRGTARLFWNVTRGEQVPARVEVTSGGKTVSVTLTDAQKQERDLALTVDAAGNSGKQALDLALVMDTTGSMSDELTYLQKELESVVAAVKAQHANLPVRLSVNVYRDTGDDYVVRSFPFSEDIAAQRRNLQAQSAVGGGDYEEAVEQALDKAINGLEWSDASAKVLLLVLDAPPHNTAENRGTISRLMAEAAEKGIRVIPVASSGVDKNTEFLMRALSVTTGGDYVFLTDHSGVGGSHIEPTIGDYEVKKLNALLVELIGGYLD